MTMVCDHCGQHESVIHLTQIVNNQIRTFHLCEACAAEKGLESSPGPTSVPLTEFIAQLGKGVDPEGGAGDGCAYCGMRLDDFKKSGRVGCSHCYVTFESHLRGLLRRLQGSTQHIGKVYLPPDPSEAQRQDRLVGLKRKLDLAVQTEDFERAAQIRDQIRSLEAATT